MVFVYFFLSFFYLKKKKAELENAAFDEISLKMKDIFQRNMVINTKSVDFPYYCKIDKRWLFSL